MSYEGIHIPKLNNVFFVYLGINSVVYLFGLDDVLWNDGTLIAFQGSGNSQVEREYWVRR